MNNLYSILAEMHPDGEFNESDLWEAIAESEGVDVYEIMDRDLTEYLECISHDIPPSNRG